MHIHAYEHPLWGVLRRIEHAARKSAATPLGCDDSPGLGHESGRGVFAGVLKSIFASGSLFSTGFGIHGRLLDASGGSMFGSWGASWCQFLALVGLWCRKNATFGLFGTSKGRMESRSGLGYSKNGLLRFWAVSDKAEGKHGLHVVFAKHARGRISAPPSCEIRFSIVYEKRNLLETQKGIEHIALPERQSPDYFLISVFFNR